jgi:hypothetical protein
VRVRACALQVAIDNHFHLSTHQPQHYRGRVMQEAVPLGEGAMVALMPIDVPTASAIAKK